MRFLTAVPIWSIVPALLLGALARPEASAPESAPKFTPKAGASVRRTIESHGTRDLKSVTLKVEDKEQEIPGATMHQVTDGKQVVLDGFRAVADGRVTKLARTYETLEKTRTETSPDKDGGENTVESKETCDLEGKTVVFTWKADKEEYGKAFEPEGGDAEALADLTAEMDYQGFLPESDAAEGSKWKGDFDTLRAALLRPGGDLSFHGERAPLAVDKRARAALWDAMKGEIELELGATSGEGDAARTTIKFHGKYASSAGAEREEDEKGPNELHLEVESEFEGELVWNPSAGRAESLTWSSKGTLEVRTATTVQKRDGGEATLEQLMRLEDESEYKVRFEAP